MRFADWRKNKLFLSAITLILVLLTLFFFRIQLCKALANYLIIQEPSSNAAYCFILSGNALDRGNKAIQLYQAQPSIHFVCSGMNISNDLKAMGLNRPESELQKDFLIAHGVADSSITILPKGSSTYEEINAIHDFCKKNAIQKASILSSNFHTRRIKLLLNKLNTEVDFSVIGCSSSNFNEREWWKSEYGLIALNNEYMKLMYYTWKY